MRGIVSYGAHIPYYRLKKETVAQAYGKRGGSMAKAVAYCDEGSVTIVVPIASCFMFQIALHLFVIFILTRSLLAHSKTQLKIRKDE